MVRRPQKTQQILYETVFSGNGSIQAAQLILFLKKQLRRSYDETVLIKNLSIKSL